MFHSIRSSTWWLLIVAPLLLFLALSVIFNAQVVRDVPVAWVDIDHSSASRSLFRQLDSSPSIKLVSYASALEAEQAMKVGEVYGLVIIPANFGSDVLTRRQPVVRAVVNGQLVLIAKVIRSAVASVLGVDQAINRGLQTLGLTFSPTDAAFAAAPVQVQLSSLYNRSGSYGQFLLPAIFLAIWQILIAITTVVHFTQRPEGFAASDEGWISTGQRLKAMMRRQIALLPWFLVQGFVAGIILFQFFAYPFFGNWLVMVIVSLLFVATCQALAWSICLLVPSDPAKAASLTGAITAPSFAFLGVTFPSSDMPSLALWWRDVLPAAQSSELMLAIANYGEIAFNPVTAIGCQLIIIGLPFALYHFVYKGRHA
ncbi:ABC transporter permease [uncultured Umboniibacter sp.]|uniref:ABC transporter permease n=1 Tax=uncultured Umboniibacter sp. TaxID=1798917 RepID=UPI00260EC4DB|nr:ABC transporter permease [uncultured Umboniibacter sp.]